MALLVALGLVPLFAGVGCLRHTAQAVGGAVTSLLGTVQELWPKVGVLQASPSLSSSSAAPAATTLCPEQDGRIWGPPPAGLGGGRVLQVGSEGHQHGRGHWVWHT